MAETKNRPEFVESLIDTVKRNGTLFTGIAAVLILLSGVTLINNPSQWWIAAVAVLGFGGVIFLKCPSSHQSSNRNINTSLYSFRIFSIWHV